MNRRSFVQHLGGLLAASLVPMGASAQVPETAALPGLTWVPLREGHLLLDGAAGTATRVVGDVRWHRSGLGWPRWAAESATHLYVTDAEGRVHVLDDHGRTADVLRGFLQPWGVAAQGDGVLVAERLGGRIMALDSAGTRRVFAAGLNGPSGLAADGPHLWVAEAGAGRLVRLSAQGAVLQAISSEDDWRPRDVAVLGGVVAAVSAVPAAVRLFDRGGRLLAEHHPAGVPQCIAAGDQLVVGVV